MKKNGERGQQKDHMHLRQLSFRQVGGIKEKTSLVRLGIKALIARESSKRLAKMKGTEKKLEMITRRRVDGK
ncbi:MAG: type II toxin-antitoxin system VapB family antitoxin [Actinomycetota bacterium]